MAFIPTDEEEKQESDMNVFGQDSAQMPQTTPTQQGQQPTDISGAQTTIQTGQAPTGGPQQPAPKKAQGSGMFTNTRKYIEANKPAAGQLTGAVSSTIQKAPAGLSKQFEQQKQNIAQRYQAQQRALGQTQQVTQQATQTAQQLVDPEQLKAQQARLQSRIGSLGQLQEGGYETDIGTASSAFQAYTPKVTAAETAKTQAIQSAEEAQKAFQEQEQRLAQLLGTEQNLRFEGSTATDYMKATLDPANLNQRDYVASQLQGKWGRANEYYGQALQAQQAMQAAQAEQKAKEEALTNLLGEQTAAQTELERLQDLQQRFVRKGEIEQDIAGIQSQLDIGKEEVDTLTTQQMRDFLTGVQKFDVGQLDTRGAEQRIKELLTQGREIGTSADVRKRLLRETFGGDYTRGASKLDELILSRAGQLGKLKEASKGAATDIGDVMQEARVQRGQSAQDLATEVRGAREGTEGDIQAQIDAIRKDLQERAATGVGGRLGELLEATGAYEGLSEEQLAALGGAQKTYGLDLQEAMKEVLGETELGLGDVATRTERARLQALNRLLGKQSDIQFAETEPGEYTAGERQVLEGIKGKITQRQQEYQKGVSSIQSSIGNTVGGAANPIMPNIMAFARTGRAPTEGDLYSLQSANYWSWAGMGLHGIAVPFSEINRMIYQARARLKSHDAKYSADQTLGAFSQPSEDQGLLAGYTNPNAPAQAPQGDTAKDGLIKRSALKRIANGR